MEIKVGQIWKNAGGTEIEVTRLLSGSFVGVSGMYPNGARYRAETPGRYRWTLQSDVEASAATQPVAVEHKSQQFAVGDRFTCAKGLAELVEQCGNGLLRFSYSWADWDHTFCGSEHIQSDTWLSKQVASGAWLHVAGPSFKPAVTQRPASCNCASQITGSPSHGDWCRSLPK